MNYELKTSPSQALLKEGREDTIASYEVSPNPSLIQHKRLHVLFAGDSQTRPDHKLGPKLYDYYLLHQVLEGRGTFNTEQRSFQLGSGDAFLITPNQLVSYISDTSQPWRYRWVAFKGDEAPMLVKRAGFTAHQPVLHVSNGSAVGEEMLRMHTAFKNREEACDLTACGSLYLIMAYYADSQPMSEDEVSLKPKNESHHIVRQMIHMMSNQYAHPFTMEQMANSLGYSRAYLSRLFKQVTEVSPVTFLLKLRIDKGRQLLRERPDLSIEQIASSVGITDSLYFSRQFRRFYQQSPTQYREHILQSDRAK